MKPRDEVRATTIVRTSPERAFAIFTDEIDAWWQRGPRFRFLLDAEGELAFEEGPEGRQLVERARDGQCFNVGRVIAWEPPTRLAFEMGARAFADAETTSVEVSFAAESGGTRVSVVHGGWAAIAAGHPVRHGLDEQAWAAMMGLWWTDLLQAADRYARPR